MIINFISGGNVMRDLFKTTRGIGCGIAFAGMIALQSLSVAATETINLTAIDGYPPKSLWVKEFIGFYIPAINKRLAKTGNYKINWNQAFFVKEVGRKSCF